MGVVTSEKPLSEKRIILTISGRLDAATAPDLKARLKELVVAGYVQLVADTSGLAFLDSSGLAAFVSGFKAAREAGGTLVLAGLGKQTRIIFELTRLDRVFEIYPDVAAAIAALPAA